MFGIARAVFGGMLTDTEKKIQALLIQTIADFYEGIALGWSSWTMDQISREIVALQAQLPEWTK